VSTQKELSDIGISRKESSNFQQIAAIPENGLKLGDLPHYHSASDSRILAVYGFSLNIIAKANSSRNITAAIISCLSSSLSRFIA